MTLDGTGSSDVDSNPLGFAWVQTGGPPVTLSSASAVSPTFTAPDEGTYTFTLTVSDEASSATDTVVVTVRNVVPLMAGPGNQTATIGVSTVFSLGSFADPGPDSPWNVDVDWGDGSSHTLFPASAPGVLPVASHVYTVAGTYVVFVKVTDGDGASSQSSFQIAVAALPTPPPPPPPVRCVVPKLKGKTLAAARKALTAGHCKVGKVTKAYSKTIKKGRVMKQTKAAGARLPAGTKIGLTISKGPRPR